MLLRSLQNKEAIRVALADWRLWAVLVFIGAAGLLLTVYASKSETSGSPIVINGIAVPPVPVLKPESVRRGQMIYTKFCANCHGQNLEGAPDWKTPLASGSFPAPPQDSSGHTWHHADLVLVEIIAKGGVSENSAMPAFGQQFADEDVLAVLDFLKSNWGKDEREFQWWVTATSDLQKANR